MLVIFYGCSCTGKTTLMEVMNLRYGWKFVQIFTTRNSRINEEFKKTISREHFKELSQTDNLVYKNEFYDNLYGVSKHDMESAIKDNSRDIYMLDFSIVKHHQFSELTNIAFIIILPSNQQQLEEQIQQSSRSDRKDKIIKEYIDYYINLEPGYNNKYSAFCIFNYFNNVEKTSECIYNYICNI